MQRNGAAPVFGFFFFLFPSEFFLSHCIYPQFLLRLRWLYGRPGLACRCPTIDAVFPCCKTRSILSIPSVIRHGGVPFQIHVLVLDAAPEPFHKDIIQCPTAPVHADRDSFAFKHASKSFAGELAALVGVEYLRRAISL